MTFRPARVNVAPRGVLGMVRSVLRRSREGVLKVLRLVLATGLMTALLGVSPAHATDCSDPKKPCGGCHINREISTSDLRPVICYA